MEHVLVVDDIQDNITLLSFELEDDGFQVSAAYNGNECLEIARRTPKPAIILLDIRMPGLSGIETLAQLKQSQTTENIPVIMVSANDPVDMIIQAIDLGAHDFVSKPIDYPVLAARMRSALRLSHAQAQLEQANEELNKLAMSDPLTSCYNRRHFFNLATKEADKFRRHQRPLSLMMIDIDYFKKINDSYGHAAGDSALKVLTECCRQASRSSDILGRIGGEEFAICCPDADITGAHALAERIRANCERLEIQTKTQVFSMTLSIGVTQLTEEELFEQALHRADRLLYEAKNNGRNCIVSDFESAESIKHAQ